MNNISNQNLQSLTSRVSAVSPKSDLVKANGDGSDKSGKVSPPDVEVAAKPVNQNPQSQSAGQQVAKENVEAVVAKLNEFAQDKHRDIQFRMDESSGRAVVTVVDSESKEVIRQIPDEIFVKLARNLKDNVDMQLSTGDADGGALHLINTKV